MTTATEPVRSTTNGASPGASLDYLAAPADEQPLRDIANEVRKLLLANGAHLTLDALQAELGAEADGEHVPLGQIEKACRDIGATVDSEQRWSLRSTEDAEKLAARRADVLEAMFDIGAGGPVAPNDIAEDIGLGDAVLVTEALDALVEAGAVVTLDEGASYDLADGIGDKIIRQGALFIARATLPELTVPVEDRTAFELAATQRFEAERAAKLTAQGERDKLAAFLREKGVDPNDILHPAEPVTPGPKRDVFLWTKIVPVDDAIELEIAREERKLRAELAMSQAGLDSETDRHKLVKTKVTGRIKELEQAIIDKSFARECQAYRVPVWEEGVTLVVKASDGTTILEREPIAKGAQRVIPGTEAATSPKAESIAPPAKDAASEASAEATTEQEQRAAALREATAAKWIAAAEELLRGMGSAGLDWGKDGDKAVNSLARNVHGKERGKLPAGFAESARAAITTLLADGRAVMSGTGDAIVWADTSDKAAE